MLRRSLVDAIPSDVKSPVLTALYERGFKEIRAGRATTDDFLTKQTEFAHTLVKLAAESCTEVDGAAVEGPECPVC